MLICMYYFAQLLKAEAAKTKPVLMTLVMVPSVVIWEYISACVVSYIYLLHPLASVEILLTNSL